MPHFAKNEQQDAQEFLGFLLDGIHEDVNQPLSPSKEISDEELEQMKDPVCIDI
jgi:ubiquitin C-terminal hydrolase